MVNEIKKLEENVQKQINLNPKKNKINKKKRITNIKTRKNAWLLCAFKNAMGNEGQHIS